MKKSLLIFVVLTIVMMSCKKSSSDSNSIVAKWKVVNDVNWHTPFNAAATKDTTLFTPDSYGNFASNGKVYFYTKTLGGGSPNYDTASYQVSGNQLFELFSDGTKDTLTIQTLTSNSLSLYAKAPGYANGDFSEEWTNFSK